jgi:hypothetical protein
LMLSTNTWPLPANIQSNHPTWGFCMNNLVFQMASVGHWNDWHQQTWGETTCKETVNQKLLLSSRVIWLCLTVDYNRLHQNLVAMIMSSFLNGNFVVSPILGPTQLISNWYWVFMCLMISPSVVSLILILLLTMASSSP